MFILLGLQTFLQILGKHSRVTVCLSVCTRRRSSEADAVSDGRPEPAMGTWYAAGIYSLSPEPKPSTRYFQL